MNPIDDFQSAPVNPTGMPTTEGGTGHTLKEQKKFLEPTEVTVTAAADYNSDSENVPTEEEMSTLRKVAAPMP